MKTTSVTIIEDDLDTYEIIKKIIETNKFKVDHHFTSAEQFLSTSPSIIISDLFIFDIQLPGMSGVELLKAARNTYIDKKITMYTFIEDENTLIEAIRNGADGYILKDTSPENFCEELCVIIAGGSSMTVRVARKLLENNNRRFFEKIGQLTDREMEILNLIAIGLTYRDISEDMEISVHTVRNHIVNIYRKLQVDNRSQAMRIYERNIDISEK